jgi:PAS domain-containing protein
VVTAVQVVWCTTYGLALLVFDPTVRLALEIIAWLPINWIGVFKLGPVPQFNLTPLMFLPHMLLDMYALFRKDMFEFKPATRRTAERAAIDDIPTAVVITDRQGRVINLNDVARETFGVDRAEVLAEPVGTLYEGDHEPGEYDLATVLCEVAADVGAEYPSVTVTCDVPDGTRVETDRQLLGFVVRSLVENALEHGGGLGLWLVSWGTTVTVRVPGLLAEGG